MGSYIFTYGLSVLIILLAALAGWVWLDKYEETKFVEIMASQEPELALPVYAQFVVTQRLRIEQAVSVTRLVVPMYAAEKLPMTVELINEGSVVESWEFSDVVGSQLLPGIFEAEFLINPPRTIEGEVELKFNGERISHEARYLAPRLFVETDDGQYEGGNYRIAENEKEGDVSASLFKREKRWERKWREMQLRPIDGAAEVVKLLLVVMVAGTVPHVLKRTVF